MTVPPSFSPASVQAKTRLQRWPAAIALTAITALCAQASAHLPFTPVPITLQVFGVLLSGLLLGSRWGFIAQAQYLALGLMGLPVFALGHSAPALFGLTGGYLWSYPIAAFVVGWIVERTEHQGQEERFGASVCACAAGLAVIYGMGCAWLALLSRPMLSPGAAFMAGAGWFVVWDTVKALAAVMVAQGWKKRG